MQSHTGTELGTANNLFFLRKLLIGLPMNVQLNCTVIKPAHLT